MGQNGRWPLWWILQAHTADCKHRKSKLKTQRLTSSNCRLQTFPKISADFSAFLMNNSQPSKQQHGESDTKRFASFSMEIMTSSSKYTAFQALSPRIFCKASKSQIQTPPHFNDRNIAKWSLANIRRDNISYRHSRKKIAKPCNAIWRPLVNIKLNHVTPLCLHILLGITKKHHDLLEDECHSLDKLIGQSLASSGKETPESSAAFHKYVAKSNDILDQKRKES